MEGNGHHPKTVSEAVSLLLAGLSDQDKASLRTIKNEDDLVMLHFSLGQAIRNDFGLWAGNQALLTSCGSADMHPDDASMVIIRAAWKLLRRESPP